MNYIWVRMNMNEGILFIYTIVNVINADSYNFVGDTTPLSSAAAEVSPRKASSILYYVTSNEFYDT